MRASLGRSVHATRFRDAFRITGLSTDRRARTADPQKRRWLSTVGFSLVQNASRLVEQRPLGRLLLAGIRDPGWLMPGGVGCPLNRITRVGRFLQFRDRELSFLVVHSASPVKKAVHKQECDDCGVYNRSKIHNRVASESGTASSGSHVRGDPPRKMERESEWRSTVARANVSFLALCDGFLKWSPHFSCGW